MLQGTRRLQIIYTSIAFSLICILSQVFLAAYSFSPETMTVGQGPWGIAVDESTDKTYVVNWGSDNVSILDGKTDTIVETINTVPKSLYVAINENSNLVYITGSQFGKTTVFNSNKPDEIQTLNLNLDYAVVNHNTNKIYAIKNGRYPDTGSILVINGSTNQVSSEISEVNQIYALSANENANVVYAAKWAGTTTNSYIYIVNGTSDDIASNIKINGRILALAYQPLTDKLYVRTLFPSQVLVLDGKNNEIKARIPLDEGSASPNGLGINKKTNTIFTVSSHLLYAINGTDNRLLGSTDIGGDFGIAASSNLNRVYVSNSDWNSITIIDTNPMMKPNGQPDTNSTKNNFGQIVVTPLSYWFEIKIAQAVSCATAGGLAATILIFHWRRLRIAPEKNGVIDSASRGYRLNLPHTIVPIFLLVLAVAGLLVTGFIWYSFAAYSGPVPSGGGALIEALLYLLISLWLLVLSIPTVIGSIFLLRGSRMGYYVSLVVLILWTLNIIWGVSVVIPRERGEYWYPLALPAITLTSAMYAFLLLGKKSPPAGSASFLGTPHT